MSWHKRLLSQSPGRREWYCWSDSEDKVALETEWLVDPLAELAKARFNQFDERSNWKGDWHHVAVIPEAVVEHEWRVHRRKMLADRDYVKHWVNQPENKAFRTRPGRV